MSVPSLGNRQVAEAQVSPALVVVDIENVVLVVAAGKNTRVARRRLGRERKTIDHREKWEGGTLDGQKAGRACMA